MDCSKWYVAKKYLELIEIFQRSTFPMTSAFVGTHLKLGHPPLTGEITIGGDN